MDIWPLHPYMLVEQPPSETTGTDFESLSPRFWKRTIFCGVLYPFNHKRINELGYWRQGRTPGMKLAFQFMQKMLREWGQGSVQATQALSHRLWQTISFWRLFCVHGLCHAGTSIHLFLHNTHFPCYFECFQFYDILLGEVHIWMWCSAVHVLIARYSNWLNMI